MYTFTFAYSNNTFQEFMHITKAEYINSLGQEIIVSGEEIASHKFPNNRNMYLFSADSSYSISKDGIKFISVTREN